MSRPGPGTPGARRRRPVAGERRRPLSRQPDSELLGDEEPVFASYAEAEYEPDLEPDPASGFEPPAASARVVRTRAALGRRVLAGALALLLVGLAVATALLFVNVHRHDRVRSAERGALSAAVAAGNDVLSYSYQSLNADFARAEKHLTPAFTKRYVSLTEKAVRGPAKDVKATAKATVVSAGSVRATPTRVTVLLFVDQEVDNSKLPKPRLDSYRLRMQMRLVGGHWLVDDIQPF